jgi:hypothetical protein
MSIEIGTMLNPKTMSFDVRSGSVPELTSEMVAAALFGSPPEELDLFMLYHSPQEYCSDGSGIFRSKLIRRLWAKHLDTRVKYLKSEKGAEIQRQLVAVAVSELVDNHKCKICRGTKYIDNKQCPECYGSGEGFSIEDQIRWIYTFSVTIPEVAHKPICELRTAHYYASQVPPARS